MPVELSREGLRVCGTPLWLDARRKTPFSFVSHAHSDHIARHHSVVATLPTLEIMAHRLGPLNESLPLDYGQRMRFEEVELELIPAGHILGAAQIRITRPDGHRIVYTGDISLSPARTARSAEVASCDTLVVESTFGHPRYRFPPREQVYDEVAGWARRTLERGVRPIIYGYSLGKSQETIRQLTDRGLAVCAHPLIDDISEIYRRAGVDIRARRYDDTFEPNEVGLFPPFGRAQSVKHLDRKVTAVLTGWALEPWAARRYAADLAFPISDHADCSELVSYAKACGAREVITLHGFAEELAKTMRNEGLFARALQERVQIELNFS